MTQFAGSLIVATVVLAISSASVWAAVSPKKAEKLKTTLTPLGATKAGSADGEIPAWTGGYTMGDAPKEFRENYKVGGIRPDFFGNEKPLYTITSQNMAKYANRLEAGQKWLFKTYPNYKMKVYPTHRTEAAPQWVYNNTFKNATRAKLSDPGGGVEGAYGGIPFPIPDLKKAKQLIWNNRWAWRQHAFSQSSNSILMLRGGTSRVFSTNSLSTYLFPNYRKDGNLKTYGKYWENGVHVTKRPGSQKGQALMEHEPDNYVTQTRGIWQYQVGQRRVRRSPAAQYDTPDFFNSGQVFLDEALMMYGPADEYNFKVLGKKEMYIPYNSNETQSVSAKKLFTPHFFNPDYVRWELHRVWVVDAKLKKSRRHSIPHRKYYIDEDSWMIAYIDGWDANNELYHFSMSPMLLAPDAPGVNNWATQMYYNARSHNYGIEAANNGVGRDGKATLPQYKWDLKLTKDYFTPDALNGRSLF